MSSLRGKITAGYYVFAATVAVVALLAFGDLTFLEQRIDRGVATSEFLDNVLELRRYEKNYFLYGQSHDYDEVRRYAEHAGRLLHEQRAVFVDFADVQTVDTMSAEVVRYLALWARYPVDTPVADEKLQRLEPAIRESGRLLAEGAEALSLAQRQRLQENVRQSRWLFLIAVVLIVVTGVLIARVLAWAVTRPLARIERDLAAVGAGQFDHLEPVSKDRELVSIAQAVNRMLQEIETRRRHLVQSEKLASLGTLVSGVAHELNNPLSNISTSCQILLEELGHAEPEALRAWLSQIDEETERARLIVRALLEFSRERAFNLRVVRLRELVERALLLISGTAARRNVEVCVPAELTMLADTQRLQQVIVNLVRNALDAGGEGVRVVISARVEAAADYQPPSGSICGQTAHLPASGRLVVLEVQDDGPGIPPDIQSKVFDPFFTTKDVGHGFGLGLFVTQEIVHQHDGCITVSSTPDTGTRFVICLPLELPEDSRES